MRTHRPGGDGGPAGQCDYACIGSAREGDGKHGLDQKYALNKLGDERGNKRPT